MKKISALLCASPFGRQTALHGACMWKQQQRWGTNRGDRSISAPILVAYTAFRMKHSPKQQQQRRRRRSNSAEAATTTMTTITRGICSRLFARTSRSRCCTRCTLAGDAAARQPGGNESNISERAPHVRAQQGSTTRTIVVSAKALAHETNLAAAAAAALATCSDRRLTKHERSG